MQATEFTDIATRQRPHLLAIALDILHDQDEAENAVQDTLFALWRWRERVDTSYEVTPLLQRMLRNYCLNTLLARRRQAKMPIHELPRCTQLSLVALSHDPQSNIEGKETEQRIRLALSRLPQRWQTILTMKLIDNIPNAEIACILNLSQTATTSLLNRAKQALIQNLKHSRQ